MKVMVSAIVVIMYRSIKTLTEELYLNICCFTNPVILARNYVMSNVSIMYLLV